MNIGRILIIVGFVVIGIGILIIVFLPDTSRGTTSVTVVNGYGAFLIIIGLVVFAVRGWHSWYKTRPSGFESMDNAIKDVKNKKGKAKIKAVLIIIVIIVFIALMFL